MLRIGEFLNTSLRIFRGIPHNTWKSHIFSDFMHGWNLPDLLATLERRIVQGREKSFICVLPKSISLLSGHQSSPHKKIQAMGSWRSDGRIQSGPDPCLPPYLTHVPEDPNPQWPDMAPFGQWGGTWGSEGVRGVRTPYCRLTDPVSPAPSPMTRGQQSGGKNSWECWSSRVWGSSLGSNDEPLLLLSARRLSCSLCLGLGSNCSEKNWGSGCSNWRRAQKRPNTIWVF